MAHITEPCTILITGIMAAEKCSVTPRLGLWVDSACQTVDETVDFILAHLAGARVDGGSG